LVADAASAVPFDVLQGGQWRDCAEEDGNDCECASDWVGGVMEIIFDRCGDDALMTIAAASLVDVPGVARSEVWAILDAVAYAAAPDDDTDADGVPLGSYRFRDEARHRAAVMNWTSLGLDREAAEVAAALAGGN
jgi:hypothetical protein